MIQTLITILTSAVLVSAPAVQTTIQPSYGDEGRLYFENGYSVALNYADAYDLYEQQYVTDMEDSACYSVSDDGVVLISDHDYQGFDMIQSLEQGAVATIRYSDGTSQKYMCVSKYQAFYEMETGYCKLPDGRHIWFGDTDFMMKTCNGDGTDTVIYWVAI